MAHLIAVAYGVADDRVVDGPKSLDIARFDVIARAGHDATAPELADAQQLLTSLGSAWSDTVAQEHWTSPSPIK